MAGTNRFMNWTAVWTPTTGSTVTFDGITSVNIDRKGSPEMFKGGIDIFYSLCVVPFQERNIEITFADAYKAAVLPIGGTGGLVVTCLDARNGVTASGGGFTLTYTGCVVVDTPFSGDHAKYTSAKVSIVATTSDGVTDPLTVASL